MPRIQTYDSQVELQQQPTPQVNMESFTGGWKNATEAFQTLDSTVKEFKKVRDYNEVSSAELNIRQEIGQIQNDAANEQDPTKIEEYKQKIDDAIAKHSNNISDKMVRAQANDKFNLSGYSAYSSIANDFRKKSIDIGQANYLKASNQYEIDYSNASNDADRNRIKADWLSTLDMAKNAGLFSADDVEKMKIAQTKKFDERDLMYDMQYLPDQVATRRANGAYSSLTNEEIQKGIDTAERIKERNIKESEVAYKKMVVENERSITNGLSAGQTFEINEISDMVSNGEISQEFGQAYVRYMTSPDSIDPANDKNGFAKYAENVFQSKDDTQVNNAIRMALEGGSDGKISREDLQFLVKFASDRGKRLTEKNPIQETMDSVWKSLTEWFDDKSPKNKNKASAEYIKTISNDQSADPVKVSQDIINREIVNKNPSITAIPKEGKMMIDAFGNKAIVFPDGSHKEVK